MNDRVRLSEQIKAVEPLSAFETAFVTTFRDKPAPLAILHDIRRSVADRRSPAVYGGAQWSPTRYRPVHAKPCCGPRPLRAAPRGVRPEYRVRWRPARPPVLISIDVPGTGLSLAYLIDPTTESCFLRDGGLTPVDCALLAKNLPQAAQHITWGARESEVTPVAPTAPPAEPTAPTAESEPR